MNHSCNKRYTIDKWMLQWPKRHSDTKCHFTDEIAFW